MTAQLDVLDHLVLATPDLPATIAAFATRSGVTPAPGGSHPGLGTANALVGLGPNCYLELVGPDPQQPEPAAARPFGIDDLDHAALVTWAVRPPDADALIGRARRSGYDPGNARSMSRRTPDGAQLSWRLTPFRGLVPFLIDWGATPHPTSRGLPTVELTSFTLRHPNPSSIQPALDGLEVPILVERSDAAALVAVLGTPHGRVVL